MARGNSGDKAGNTFEGHGATKERAIELTLRVYEEQEELAIKYLTIAINTLNKHLGRNDKVKGGLTELAMRLIELADTTGGLMKYHEMKREEVAGILDDVAVGRDDHEKAIDAKYQIKLLDIIQAANERRLKEKSNE
jgi:hypothetical protein